jgi:hypothetical protein
VLAVVSDVVNVDVDGSLELLPSDPLDELVPLPLSLLLELSLEDCVLLSLSELELELSLELSVLSAALDAPPPSAASVESAITSPVPACACLIAHFHRPANLSCAVATLRSPAPGLTSTQGQLIWHIGDR